MSAFIRVVDDQDRPILQRYLDKEGVVLVSKEIADKLEKQIGRPIDGDFLDGYDFGGESDVSIEFVSREDHYCINEILEKLGDEKDGQRRP